MSSIPLILLPGQLNDAALWSNQIRDLADLAAPILVPDLTQDETLGAMAERVLAAAPPVFAAAGLSMGGYLLFELLRQAPERIDRVAFLNTSARADDEVQARRRRGLSIAVEIGQFKGVTRKALPGIVAPENVDKPGLADIVMTMTERVGRVAFQRQQRALLARPDSRPDLSAIDVPVLVIAGAQDRMTPPDRSEEIAAGIPHARLEILDPAGHLTPLEQPERVSELMRAWLER
ncbi:alpha/beta fold hydrolase [Roseiterribacter gracilis]|uniref:Hydrolase n=1 Tax=Roseiterribacter gracilis TaxID=2812848 RepID=A0A8S8X7U4_9PROT|nr:hydrolase [Rhodospirillales bacterium TMPK1]